MISDYWYTNDSDTTLGSLDGDLYVYRALLCYDEEWSMMCAIE